MYRNTKVAATIPPVISMAGVPVQGPIPQLLVPTPTSTAKPVRTAFLAMATLTLV
jgi:hypothetical protein